MTRAFFSSLKKFSPKEEAKNPVMFTVYIGAILTALLFVLSIFGIGESFPYYTMTVSIILWLTVFFSNFAESVAESRGIAIASSLRKNRKEIPARKLKEESFESEYTEVTSNDLRIGDIVLVKANELIPMDGEVIRGAASVDESAITGESAPVIRESGGDRSAVTGGTTVTSDVLIIKVSAEAGKSFLDKMISMVEGAKRKRTPNEMALSILLITLTIIFLVVAGSLVPFSIFSSEISSHGSPISITNAVALFVCLAPTTIGALLSAIGIAGMARLNKVNVLALSGRAVEAAGDIDVLLLDKTGTITLGNRQATAFIPVGGISEERLAEASFLSSVADETAEGRSIVILAKNLFGFRGTEIAQNKTEFIPFSAKTRMSGISFSGREIRKGAAEAIKVYVEKLGGHFPLEAEKETERISKEGGTPLLVAEGNQVLGIIYLKDIVKEGIAEKFASLRVAGIRTVMVTGDNHLTAATIAAEAGVDDYVAEATPETKLALIRKLQSEGRLVAMTGDGTNDAPALAQADVALAMNTGTQAAKEAGNMIDLDSNPAKLVEVVRVGKQLLITRGAITTFSVANDVAKYFAVIPPLFGTIYPGLNYLNFMHLTSATTAMLSSLIYNALIILALIPLSLRGVKYRALPASKILSRNLLIYGLGGILAPFVFIKLFDILITLMGIH